MKEEKTVNVAIHEKETHTDQYLNCASNHHLNHKRSVVHAVMDRTERLVSEDCQMKPDETNLPNETGWDKPGRSWGCTITNAWCSKFQIIRKESNTRKKPLHSTRMACIDMCHQTKTLQGQYTNIDFSTSQTFMKSEKQLQNWHMSAWNAFKVLLFCWIVNTNRFWNLLPPRRIN